MLVCDEWSMFFRTIGMGGTAEADSFRTIGNMGGTAEADSFCPRDFAEMRNVG